MRTDTFNVWLIAIFSLGGSSSASSELSNERNQKHFSLFSVVTFKNDECASATSLAGGARNGTCYSATECSNKKGTKSGNCAAGFGVCCVFLANADSASQTITENRTHLRNNEFPTAQTAATAKAFAYTISKASSDICQLRLDFLTFVIAGPFNTKENIPGTTLTTHCTNDHMTLVQSSSGDEIPTLCGTLTGEHLYIDLGREAAGNSLITITTAVASSTLTASVAGRKWDIKTSQIECFANYRAPEGCDRWLTSNMGKITSYNYIFTVAGGDNLQNSGIELANQELKTCIRRSKGMCCVQYQVCASYAGIALGDALGTVAGAGITGRRGTYNEGWRLDTDTHPAVIDAVATASDSDSGLVDGMCTGDYVEIPSSWSSSCGTNTVPGTINTRYCGAKFGANFYLAQAGTTSTPVCDCSEPFYVTHHSDLANDIGGPAAVATNAIAQNVTPRGFCLDFVQQPCWY